MAGADGSDYRINRDKSRDQMIDELRGDESPFKEIRQILLFAACLGFRHGRREPVKSRSDSVRWDTLIAIEGAEAVVSMIALSDSGEKDIVGSDGLKRSLEIFEEYANAGLSIIAERLSTGGFLVRELINELVSAALETDRSGDDDDPLGLLKAAR